MTVFGKKVNELQTDVVVNDTDITGTLKYVTGYTDFSSEPTEQEGNYLVLKFEADPESVTTVEVVGGSKGPVILDSDMMHIMLIKNKDTQDVRVVSKKGDLTADKTYDLSKLTLEQKSVG